MLVQELVTALSHFKRSDPICLRVEAALGEIEFVQLQSDTHGEFHCAKCNCSYDFSIVRLPSPLKYTLGGADEPKGD